MQVAKSTLCCITVHRYMQFGNCIVVYTFRYLKDIQISSAFGTFEKKHHATINRNARIKQRHEEVAVMLSGHKKQNIYLYDSSQTISLLGNQDCSIHGDLWRVIIMVIWQKLHFVGMMVTEIYSSHAKTIPSIQLFYIDYVGTATNHMFIFMILFVPEK